MEAFTDFYSRIIKKPEKDPNTIKPYLNAEIGSCNDQ